MQFNKNKTASIHQWYPFVEGYSKEFISNIINEIDYIPNFALDPFAGSGTTPVELQNLGVKCYSFEVSPFMHLLATVKLENKYKIKHFIKYSSQIRKILSEEIPDIREFISPPIGKTFQPNENNKKWLFNTEVMNGILDIKYGIQSVKDKKYQRLFSIIMASILLDVSNVYRNGKCLSYKKKWQDNRISRKDVHKKFLDKLFELILNDIEKIEHNNFSISNLDYCIYGDVRTGLSKIKDNTIDLVITSPPYLNSRDYTDIYLAELWILDLIKNYDELKNLRKNTFRSHVQVRHDNVEIVEIEELKNIINQLSLKKDIFWNKGLLGMIKGYFKDMDILFSQLKLKMKPNKKIYFNVANSAYYGIEIKVDEIVSMIAESHGFIINEIREARQLKPSGQQKDTIKSLRESVIVMTS